MPIMCGVVCPTTRKPPLCRLRFTSLVISLFSPDLFEQLNR